MTTDPTTVLVVEDEVLLLMLVAETLRDAGFAVHEAGDGETALSILRNTPEIAALVTDIRMPGMNGFELTAAARAMNPGLKVLLMTGYSREDLPQSIADVGIDLLRKPFDVDDVPNLVNRLLGSGGP